MLQSTKPERLSNKEDTRKDSWISQERGSRIELVGGLGGTSGDGNSRDQAGGLRGRESMRRTIWNLVSFGSDVETYCNGNFLDSTSKDF